MNEYNPRRIQVLVHKGYGPRSYTYQIVVRDVTVNGLESIVDNWRIGWRDTPSGWQSGQVENGRHLTIESRKKAVEIAKRLAGEYGYTFSPSTDVVEADKVLRGPKQACVSCGADMERGFAPTICRTCKEDITRGAAVRQSDDVQVVVIEPDRLTGLPTFYRSEIATLEYVLPYILGAPLEPMNFSLRSNRSSFVFISAPWRMKQEEERSYFEPHTGMKVIRLPEKQVVGLKMLAELFQRVRDDAYAKGKREGEGMLVKIATGELTVEQLQAKT